MVQARSPGVLEILLGLGLVHPATRRFAALGLVALFIAVFPANLYMAVANVEIQGLPAWLPQPSAAARWLRLPLQAVFVLWALRVSREGRAAPSAAAA